MPLVPGLPRVLRLPAQRRRTPPASLDEHPNNHEIRGILGRVPRLTDHEIERLARGWRDTNFLAAARDHALSFDSPLIVDVLVAFARIDTAFSETAPTRAFGVVVKPQLANIALKAIRDAVAAAYARPVLGRAEYIALIGPWRRLFPDGE